MSLCQAVKKGDALAVETLLKSGTFVDERNACQRTPLILAAKEGSAEITNLLLDAGANVHARGSDQWNASHHAAFAGNVNVLQLLCDVGAVHQKTLLGHTPLHISAAHGRVEAARILLEKGADKEARDLQGARALDIAKDKGYEDMISILA